MKRAMRSRHTSTRASSKSRRRYAHYGCDGSRCEPSDWSQSKGSLCFNHRGSQRHPDAEVNAMYFWFKIQDANRNRELFVTPASQSLGSKINELGKPSLNRSGSGQLQGSRRSQDSRTTSRRAATSRASHGKASAPSEKLMRCRCKKLSRCSTIARARRSTIRLESTNSREVAQIKSEMFGSRNFAITNSSIS